MSSVTVKENESLDSALRRFKRNCAKAGIQQEIRKREHYEKPSVRRKKKSEAARKKKIQIRSTYEKVCFHKLLWRQTFLMHWNRSRGNGIE